MRYTLAVSAVAPSSKHFLLLPAAADQKPFVNKDLCNSKSAKTNCKEVRKVRNIRLASAWQLKMSGSFSRG